MKTRALSAHTAFDSDMSVCRITDVICVIYMLSISTQNSPDSCYLTDDQYEAIVDDWSQEGGAHTDKRYTCGQNCWYSLVNERKLTMVTK